MKRTCVLFALMCLASSAFGGTVNLHFLQPAGVNANGEYTYPYNFTVNGQFDKLMCVTLANQIIPGETWQANRYSVASLWGTANAPQFDEAAWLLKQEKPNNNEPAINWAAWAVFDQSIDLSQVIGAGNWLTAAQSQVYAQGQFADVFVYDPIPGRHSAGVSGQYSRTQHVADGGQRTTRSRWVVAPEASRLNFAHCLAE